MEWVARLGQTKETDHTVSKHFNVSNAESGNRTDKNYDKLKQTVHQEVIREYNDRFSDSTSGKFIDVMDIIHQAIARQEESLTRLEESKLAQEIYDDVTVIGDAKAPRKILTAIHEGYHAIRVMEQSSLNSTLFLLYNNVMEELL